MRRFFYIGVVVLHGDKMKNTDDLLMFEEVDANDIGFENSSGCRTTGTASGCCTMYCPPECMSCLVDCSSDRKEHNSFWEDFLADNSGIVQY